MNNEQRQIEQLREHWRREGGSELMVTIPFSLFSRMWFLLGYSSGSLQSTARSLFSEGSEKWGLKEQVEADWFKDQVDKLQGRLDS